MSCERFGRIFEKEREGYNNIKKNHIGRERNACCRRRRSWTVPGRLLSSGSSRYPSLTLTDLSLTVPPIFLTIQSTDAYAAKYAVMLPLVVQVFEYFFQTGNMLKQVRWELDDTGEET